MGSCYITQRGGWRWGERDAQEGGDIRMFVCQLSCFSLVRLSATLRTVAHHAQYGDTRMLIEALLIIVSKVEIIKVSINSRMDKEFSEKNNESE